MVFSRGHRIFEWPTMHLSNEIHYYSRNGVSSTRENCESSSLNGQNNLILEMLNPVISWKRKSIYEIPIPTPFCEAMPKVTFSNHPPTIPAILPLAKSLPWSIQQRRKTLSQSSRPALFKFLMQHRFIPLCLYSGSQEKAWETNLSLKLACASINFLCIRQGAINPIRPSWDHTRLVRNWLANLNSHWILKAELPC